MKGKELNVKVENKGPTIHSCIALSDESTEGIILIDRPFKAQDIVDFLISNFSHYVQGEKDGDEGIVLILDNAAQHRSHDVQDLLKNLKFKCLSIPPYSP